MRTSAWLAVVVLLASFGASAERTVGKPGHALGAASDAVSDEQPPAHAATGAQAREIIALTGASDVKQQMLDGLLPHVKEMLPWMPEAVLDDIRRSITVADFDAAVIRSYRTHLSEEDAAQIIAFFRSPAGRRMVGALPQIETEGQQAGAELGRQIMLDVMSRHQAEIDAAKQKYEQERSKSIPQP